MATVCFLSAGAAAHAGAITYDFSPTSSQLFFNGTFSGVRLLDTHGGMPSNSGKISTNLAAFSFAPASRPENVSMPIDLTLRDGNNTSQPVQLGTLTGLVWHNGSAGWSYTSMTTSLNFEGHTYTFSSPSIAHASGFGVTAGRLTFNVTDPPITPPPTPPVPPGSGSISSVGGATTPEPSSLLLASIGVPLLGIFLRRRRRRV